MLSFAELALMLPRSGSVSAYTQAALGPGLAIVATLSGYVAVALLGIPAELILVDTLLAQVAPGLVAALPYPSLVLLLLFCLLNLRGIDLFARIQSALVAIMFGGCSSSASPGFPAAAQPRMPRRPPSTPRWRCRWWRSPSGAWSGWSSSAR